jgi:CRISPR-associated protein Cas2
MALTVVVAYDISEDDRRARVAALLQTCGDRIQRSVFLCRVTSDDLDDVIARLRTMIDPRTDAVHVFRQCRACWEDAVVIGQASVAEPEPYWVVM